MRLPGRGAVGLALAWSIACGGGTQRPPVTEAAPPVEAAGQGGQSGAAGEGAEGEPGSATADDGNSDSEENAYETLALDKPDSVIAALKDGATHIGCSLVAEEGQGVAYQCPEGTIFVVQMGAELRWTCQQMNRDTCRDLLRRIVDRALDAAAGG